MSINDGLALIRRHDYEGALPLLAAEVRKRPDDAYAAYYLAYAFVGAQDPQPAVTLLAKIIEVHPDFTDAHTLLGLARIRISDFAGAAVEYEAVLGREPKNAAALLGMGMIAFWKRETAMAEDYLDRALRGDPGARDALVFKADLRFAAGDMTGAVMLLMKMTVRFRVLWSSRSKFRICPCMETSSFETGSSATSSAGPSVSARAMTIRCRALEHLANPNFIPLAFATANAALSRSEIILRSCSASEA